MADEQPIVVESKWSVHDELEKLAEGFERRNFHFVTMCLKKIVDAVAPPSAHESVAEEAVSTHGLAELHKAGKALDTKDFHLAGMCFRKAVAAYEAAPPALTGITILNPALVKTSLDDLVRQIPGEEFSSAATSIRHLASAVGAVGDERHPVVVVDRTGWTEEPVVESEPSGMFEAAAAASSPVEHVQDERMANLHERLDRLEGAWEATHSDLQATKTELHQLRDASTKPDGLLPERQDIPPIV